jgi:uncharacterized membrane protein YebE (DUF533 family)
MSLVGTLAKVAIGVAVAKGIGGMMKQAQGGTSGSGGTFGGTHSPRGNGLEDMMGEILGGRGGGTSRTASTQSDGGLFGGNSQGGLGGLLEELGGKGGGGQSRTTQSGGGLGDVIGSLGQGGGLGDLLGGLLGGAAAGGAARNTKSFGDILNQSLGNRGEPEVAPTPEQDAAAGLMLRAMIQAAKSDGKIDDHEKQKLLSNLGDVSPAEQQFVQAEMAAPIDVDGLARQVPRGLAPQVYTMSVMAIDLDNQNEAKYLHALATALGIGKQDVNQMHARLGVPALYA